MADSRCGCWLDPRGLRRARVRPRQPRPKLTSPAADGSLLMIGNPSPPTFRIQGAVEVARLGFGAMRVVGPGIWGEPADHDEVIRTLKRLPALGVNFIDTADSYGPNIAEELIHEALFPYDGLLIATKAGLVRTGPDRWIPLGRPEYLIQQAHASRHRLGVE